MPFQSFLLSFPTVLKHCHFILYLYSTYALSLVHCHFMLSLNDVSVYCTYALSYFTRSCYTVIRQCKATLSIYTVIIYFLYTLLLLHVDRYCYVHTVTRKKSCYIVTRHCHSCTFIRHCHWHTVSDTDSMDIVIWGCSYTLCSLYICQILSQGMLCCTITVSHKYKKDFCYSGDFFLEKSMLEQVCKLVLCLVQ